MKSMRPNPNTERVRHRTDELQNSYAESLTQKDKMSRHRLKGIVLHQPYGKQAWRNPKKWCKCGHKNAIEISFETCVWNALGKHCITCIRGSFRCFKSCLRNTRLKNFIDSFSFLDLRCNRCFFQ